VDLKEDETKAFYDPVKKKWVFEGEEEEEEDIPLPPPKVGQTLAKKKDKEVRLCYVILLCQVHVYYIIL
jgi:hypothetical protein